MATPVAGAVSKAVGAGAGEAATGATAGAAKSGAQRGASARMSTQSAAQARKPPATSKRGTGTSRREGAGKLGKSKGSSPFSPFGAKGATKATQRFLIAEYITCFVLIAVTPIVARKPHGTEKNALYVANDFVRLSAVSLLFFILALLSSGPRSGRIASAFGALVTLGVVYNSAPGIVGVASVFTEADKAKGNVVTEPAGDATVRTAAYIPVDLGKNPAATPGSSAPPATGGTTSGTVQA